MNKLSNFKTKIFVCELIFISVLAVTGLIVFAVGPDKAVVLQPTQSSTVVEPTDKDVAGVVPVVVLDDGKTSKVVSLNDFLKLVKKSKVDAVVPAAQAGSMTDIVRLQHDITAGNAQIKLLEKIAEKMDKKDEKKSQDSWWLEGWKEGLKFPKEKIRSAGVFLVKVLVGGSICGLMCVGGIWLGYRFIVLPTYCGTGMSSIPWFISYLPFLGRFIHPSLYNVCDSYYGNPTSGLPTPLNSPDCNCEANFLSAQCVGECFPS